MLSSLQHNGLSLDLSIPCVMGIVNLNNDSFYKPSRYETLDSLRAYIDKALEEGMSIIDLGVFSSRPGAELGTADAETARLIPILKELRKVYPKVFISIDTYHSKVAKQAEEEGANMINDISGGSIDKEMFDVISNSNIPYVLMHMQGIPGTMQENPSYKNVTYEILQYLIQLSRDLRNKGAYQIVIDPGFGFGKTIAQNFQLLDQLHTFKILNHPILVGLSRKSMIYKTLESDSFEALNGTTSLHTIALERGAKILRAHDVKQAHEAVLLHQNLIASRKV